MQNILGYYVHTLLVFLIYKHRHLIFEDNFGCVCTWQNVSLSGKIKDVNLTLLTEKALAFAQKALLVGEK